MFLPLLSSAIGSAVLVPTVQHNDTAFLQLTLLLNLLMVKTPCAINITLLLIYSIYKSLQLLIFYPIVPLHSFLFLPVTTSLFSISMSLFPFVIFIHFCFWFCIEAITYGILLSLTHFTKHNTLQICPYCHKWQGLIPLYG